MARKLSRNIFVFRAEAVLRSLDCALTDCRPLAGSPKRCYLAETSLSFLFLLPFSVLFCRKVMVQLWSVRSGSTQLRIASLLCVCKPHLAGCAVHDTDPFMCVDVHACFCMGMFIPLDKLHLWTKPAVLHQVESFPYNRRPCNWRHVSQMREFQTLLDFSGTRMSCGSGPDRSNITLYCCCRGKRDDNKGSAPYILKITTRRSDDE